MDHQGRLHADHDTIVLEVLEKSSNRWRFRYPKKQLRRCTPALSSLPSWLLQGGWRATISAGAGLSVLSLLTNMAILFWGLSKPTVSVTGNPMLFKGSYSQVQTIYTWSHLGINILSTLLLGSSNAAMQCLSAPTRNEIDEMHSMGDWLDIGISGFSWKAMKLWRKILWISLALSSLPLHLL